MPDVDEHEADTHAPTTTDEPAVSWGPTFGPETGEDAARPPRRRPARKTAGHGWHPPGGPW